MKLLEVEGGGGTGPSVPYLATPLLIPQTASCMRLSELFGHSRRSIYSGGFTRFNHRNTRTTHFLELGYRT